MSETAHIMALRQQEAQKRMAPYATAVYRELGRVAGLAGALIVRRVEVERIIREAQPQFKLLAPPSP